MLAWVLNVLFIKTCINNAYVKGSQSPPKAVVMVVVAMNACVMIYALYSPSRLAMEKR
jgi:hypothetical protein